MQISNKNLSLEYDFDPEIKSRVIGDSLRLKQVVLNLLTNAVKFTTTGAIEIKVKQVSLKDNIAKIAISVSDHGIGIP
ncbi:MAG: multi-sensor hybrid histidine kinase, partial [uncultured bacterium]